MLITGSSINGYDIEASDGRIGTVKNVLFDDSNWKIRWLVIDTGHWLSGRQVLVHPSAIGTPDHGRRHLPVHLTKAQIEASPEIQQDRPVTMQMQSGLYDYYGWDPYWGGSLFGAGLGAMGPMGRFTPALPEVYDDGDPHLRSMTDVTGYHIHASDGTIGHVENFLVDDATWAIHYLIVDTRNWWPGAHVLISPFAVKDIDWTGHAVHLNVTRERVKASPTWDPVQEVERLYQKRLHEHYGWEGYGW
jgi:sporulation protein YlmC with PRC-barrel domain